MEQIQRFGLLAKFPEGKEFLYLSSMNFYQKQIDWKYYFLWITTDQLVNLFLEFLFKDLHVENGCCKTISFLIKRIQSTDVIKYILTVVFDIQWHAM